MAFLAPRVSVHPSGLGGYGQDGLGIATMSKEVMASIVQRDRHVCRICGLPVGGDPQIFFADGNRRNSEADNLATACPACVLIQGAGRFSAAAEIIPIWLPEMSQRSLNRLIASLHEKAVSVGLPLDFSRAPTHDTPQARQILKVWGGLVERRAVLLDRTQIRTVADVVDICLAHDPRCGCCPIDLANVLRFLHRGRFYVEGCDIYPRIVAARTTRPPRSLAA